MLRNTFWVLALGVIVMYLFFLVLGSFGFDEVLPVSLTVMALALLWTVHAWLDGRREQDHRDPRFVHARERRGF